MQKNFLVGTATKKCVFMLLRSRGNAQSEHKSTKNLKKMYLNHEQWKIIDFFKYKYAGPVCIKKWQKSQNRAFVFNIFILLFSLFLFVLKFILCVAWTFFFFSFFFLNGFCHLTHLNKITKNDFMLYNPPGGHSYWLHQGAIVWSNTVWGSSI